MTDHETGAPLSPVSVIMPKLEMSQETATIMEWLVQEGQRVEKGQPLLVVETDKVTVEVESPATGVLAAIRYQAQETVPVTETIAQIVASDERFAESVTSLLSESSGERIAGPLPARSSARTDATPLARRVARDLGVDLGTVAGKGARGRITRADVEAMGTEGQAPSSVSTLSAAEEPGVNAGRPRATPAARHLAREMGLDLHKVVGSGPGGRIQAADVQRALPGFAEPDSVAAGEIARAAAHGSLAEQVVPLTGLRATIARRMTLSYQTAPHIHLRTPADVGQANLVREQWAALAGEKVSLTVVLVKACAWALRRHPQVNATIDDQGIHLLRDVNIGVAVALEEGLIVPVLKQADRRPGSELAVDLQDLVQRAHAGTLTVDQVSGGTFTLTNLGMFGVESFDPILNPPQVAILGAGAVVPTAMPSEDGVVFRPRMQLTLGADHRALDGAGAARFLADVVKALEQPALMVW